MNLETFLEHLRPPLARLAFLVALSVIGFGGMSSSRPSVRTRATFRRILVGTFLVVMISVWVGSYEAGSILVALYVLNRLLCYVTDTLFVPGSRKLLKRDVRRMFLGHTLVSVGIIGLLIYVTYINEKPNQIIQLFLLSEDKVINWIGMGMIGIFASFSLGAWMILRSNIVPFEVIPDWIGTLSIIQLATVVVFALNASAVRQRLVSNETVFRGLDLSIREPYE
jgi:hypothetical protein